MMDLEKLFSPESSSHRPIEKTDDLVKIFCQIHLEETNRVKKIYNNRLDVRYGDTERQAVDIYFDGEEYNKPIFAHIHGGYWICHDKAEAGICVAPLVKRGYKVIVMDHDLCPSVTLEEIINQMKKFLKFLLDYAVETNAEKVSFSGHCAGAYLIAMILQQDWLDLPHTNLIKDFFLMGGLYDLREMRKTKVGNANNVLSLDEKLAEKLSPLLFSGFPKSAESINIIFIIGEHDSPEFQRQSREFCKKLKLANLTTKYIELAGHDHFTLVEELRNESSTSMRLILNELGLE